MPLDDLLRETFLSVRVRASEPARDPNRAVLVASRARLLSSAPAQVLDDTIGPELKHKVAAVRTAGACARSQLGPQQLSLRSCA